MFCAEIAVFWDMSLYDFIATQQSKLGSTICPVIVLSLDMYMLLQNLLTI